MEIEGKRALVLGGTSGIGLATARQLADAGAKVVAMSRSDRNQHRVIAADLAGPAGLAWAGETSVYVSEALGGTVSEIDLATGTRKIIATGIAQPEGLTRMLDGRIAVVEVGGQRVIAIDPATGSLAILASDLPVGEPYANAPPPVYLPSGIAQGRDGSLFVSADRNNSILRLFR